jgi:protein PhnA
MRDQLPNCPKCNCQYTYEIDEIYTCPECSYEWPKHESKEVVEESDESDVIKDANGVILNDGDTVTVIKDLKVKGSSLVVKVGTKVKNIRLVGGDHDIDCKIPGIGSMKLKSEFVKKV